MKLHFPELAAFALETLRRGHPENTKNMHKLAQHYMAHELPEKASEVYQNIIKVNPRDMEAAKADKDAAAKTSILRQGWSGANFRDAMKDSGEAAKLEMLSKQGMTTEQMEQFLADTIAWVQTLAIAVGHVLAVAAAHDRAISRYPHAVAVRSQYPMLGVMVVYTVVGLFLLLGA